ncbi:MAG: GNAT family N-acetyltransferase [Chitinophagales bacterium]|nr:GNAT family N-acetyltransferase [Chitinophagales bacterium]
MKWTFKIIYSLSDENIISLRQIYAHSNYKSFHQDPDWIYCNPEKIPVLLVLNQANEIIAYTAVGIKPFRTINISFGPVTNKNDEYALMINEMVKWLKKKFWWRLTLQLPMPLDSNTDLILTRIRNSSKFRQSDSFFNWKTAWLNLDQEPEQLFLSFSNQHRKSIEKSLKSGLSYKIITDINKAEDLANLHMAMYKKRRLPINEQKNKLLILSLFKFLQQSGKGFMLAVEMEEQLLGGVVIVFQGNVAYYYLGASTTEKKKRTIPILYGAFFDIIRLCREYKIGVLDFGGLPANELPGSQLYNINRFKLGFGGFPVHYPPQLVFDLIPVLSRTIEQGIVLRNFIRERKHKK